MIRAVLVAGAAGSPERHEQGPQGAAWHGAVGACWTNSLWVDGASIAAVEQQPQTVAQNPWSRFIDEQAAASLIVHDVAKSATRAISGRP